MFVFEKLAEHSKVQSEKVITTFQGRETTYGQFYQQAKNLAGYFQIKGYQKEDKIALLLNNSDYFLICYYACQLGGFTVIPINTKLTVPEIEYILTHSAAKALIYDDRLNEIIHQLNLEQFENLLVVGKDSTFENILLDNSIPFQEVLVDQDDTAIIFYTSGTTGRPKGVMLSAGNVRAIIQIWGEALELKTEDRMQISTPLFHCAATHCFSVPVIYKGGTVVIEEAFSPEKTLNTMELEKVTIFFGVPAMYSIMLNMPRMAEMDLSNLRLFAYGAAPMPYVLVRQIKTQFPDIKVQNLYGQTENSPGATTLKDHYALNKIGSVGEMLPRTEVKVVDPEGNAVPVGEVGEIIVKGPQVMKGYFKNEVETKIVLRDSWMYSGDLGRFDEDGLLYIVDRKKDMIIRGGENIYPIEVEEVLYQIPEILEAAVIGIPHQVYGEVPKAYIVLKEGQQLSEEQVVSYCKTKLAKYKLPVEVVFMNTLPRNASGKVLKQTLRGNPKSVIENQ
ncbi:acyl-CoA synthetase (AMP-forming)/AMP-acid ligase II [Schinkia azotoformans MEV2011]|uniref:Acyl-CoA synthetase (AMP-forming)/AMP-acid ligase II n=1 Tax=Schinkia azotoformans MEV2011 TaxID=1348973 RepID=A0A072NJZ9_SCHAZ|nr:long-chain-fatty-acid--CoA ligase [Schinkia azotoformans]KEF37238.1 acyl-CoA synthetase (AMP-forming)/AMP-acid ligase II [Schinkia azotoformans MEV2011]MEC1697380.1 long-chain-fatty-acid--CoA ligase [Schinkia azotoformans]MEC1714610.1 long-chain-fatty-acid--CoA ligase [Schinkia azotoformans]MEC1724340.1 long-chain-fatty-acid--CoA ligase [Schinkia azotoformans]MEC1742939.1 long-chain-fatty-acid--CoA ligase [Schinkia azotoformans]